MARPLGFQIQVILTPNQISNPVGAAILVRFEIRPSPASGVVCGNVNQQVQAGGTPIRPCGLVD